MSEDLQSMVASVVVLGAAALVALFLTIVRIPAVDSDRSTRRRLIGLAVLAVAVQSGHFVEELLTGHDEWSEGSVHPGVAFSNDGRLALVGQTQGNTSLGGGELVAAGESDLIIGVYDLGP